MDKWALHRLLNSIRCTNSEAEALDNLAAIIAKAREDKELYYMAIERLENSVANKVEVAK